MATINQEYELVEQTFAALCGGEGDMPEGLYAIKVEDLDFIGKTTILFARVDGDGDWAPLGKATQNDRLGGWKGRLDTRSISFDDEAELQAEFRRVLREEAVVL